MELFKNKYLPKNFDNYIGDMSTLQFYIEEALKNKIKDKAFLLYGLPGTGKSTVVTLMAKKLNMNIHITNSSDDRNKINGGIIHTGSLLNDKKKLIVFDECDGMNPKIFKELSKVISNYSPIILIANDSSKIPNFIKQKCYQKQMVVNRFSLKVLAKRIIKEESLDISDDQLNKDLSNIDSYRSLLDYLQFGSISNKGSFGIKENLQDQITFTNDNSEDPKLISLADIFYKRSQQGFKSGQKISKFILDSIDKNTDDYPRTYRLLHEIKQSKNNKNSPIKILKWCD